MFFLLIPGKFLMMYDDRQKQFFVYNPAAKTTSMVSDKIGHPVNDEENDEPDDPNAYGLYKWMENDKGVLIYDKYDVWKVDPENKVAPVCMTAGMGRKQKIQYRIINTDRDEKFVKPARFYG